MRAEQISANSYGTAMQKMEAYTNSYQAASQRLTVAMEKFALDINWEGRLTDFKDILGFVVENLGAFGASIALATLFLDKGGAFKPITGILSRFGNAAMRYGDFFDFSDKQGGNKNKIFSSVIDANTEVWDSRNRVRWQNALDNQIEQIGFATVEETNRAKILAQGILKENQYNDVIDQKIASALLMGQSESQLASSYTLEQVEIVKNNLARSIFNQLSQEEQNAILNSTRVTEAQTEEERDLAIATETLARARKNNGKVLYETGNVMGKMELSPEEKKKQATLSMVSGVAAMAGGAAGLFAAQGFGEMAKAFTGSSEFADTMTAIGTVGGPLIGSAIGRKIPGALSAAFSGGGASAVVTALGGTIGAALTGVGIGVIVAGIVGSIIKKVKEETLKQQKTLFTDLSNEFSEMQSVSSSAAEYDKLAQGVDRFGHNVSLSNEDYAKFLEIGTNLAKQFPSLITYVDETGQQFVGMEGAIGGVTESIDKLIAAQQKLVDQSLIAPEFLNESFEEAKKKINNVSKEVSDAQNIVGGKDLYYAIGDYEMASTKDLALNESKQAQLRNFIGGAYAEKMIDNAKSRYNEAVKTVKEGQDEINRAMAEANQSIENQAQAIIRLSDYQDGLDALDAQSRAVANTIIQKRFSTLDISNMDTTKWQAQLKQIVKETLDLINDPELGGIVVDFQSQISEADTVGEIKEIRGGLIKALLESFGDEIDPNEMQFLTSNGFQQIDGMEANTPEGWTDTQDAYQNFLAASGQDSKGYGVIPHGILSTKGQEFFNSLSEEQSKLAISLANQDWLGADSGEKEIRNLLYWQSDLDDADENLDRFYRKQLWRGLPSEGEAGGQNLDRLVDDALVKAANGEVMSKDEIAQTFAPMGEEYWNLLYNTLEETSENVKWDEDLGEFVGLNGLDAGKFIDEVKQKLDSSDLADKANNLQVIATQSLKEAFGQEAFAGMNIDGIIDSWKEVASVLDTVASSYEKLADATAEQRQYGKLSIQTALDLITTNENMIDAIDIQNGKITLNKNATKIMAQAQMDAARTALEAANAEDEKTISTLEARKASLEAAVAADEQAVADGNGAAVVVKTTPQKVESYKKQALAAAAYFALAQGISDLEQGKTVTLQDVQKTVADLYNPIADLDGDIEAVDLAGNTETVQARLDRNKKELEKIGDRYTLDAEGELVEGTGSGELGRLDRNVAFRRSLMESMTWEDFEKSYYKGGKRSGTDNNKQPYQSTRDKLAEITALLESYDKLIDKEWEAMKAFDRDTYTEYFEKKRESLEAINGALTDEMAQNEEQLNSLMTGNFAQQIQALASLDKNLVYESDGSLKEEAELRDNLAAKILEKEQKADDLEGKIITNQKAINNLDDEEVEDKIKIAELQGVSVNRLIEMNRELLRVSDTEEERLERQKKLNELIVKEISLRKKSLDWQNSLLERDRKFFSGNASSNSIYDELWDASFENLDKKIDLQKDEIKEKFFGLVAGVKDSQDWADMWKDASIDDIYQELLLGGEEVYEGSEEVLQAITELWEMYDTRSTWAWTQTQDKISEIERRRKLIQNQRPDEWSASKYTAGDIAESFDQDISQMKVQVSIYQKFLNEAWDATDAQRIEAMEKINELTLAMHQEEVNKRKAMDEMYNSQYDAIVYRINLWKDEIQDAMDKINQEYDDMLGKLQDANDERDRAIELEDLLLAKQNASKEKERVYREGIHMPLNSYIG